MSAIPEIATPSSSSQGHARVGAASRRNTSAAAPVIATSHPIANPKVLLMRASLCIGFPWLTITPRGVVVDPEVYCRKASVSGSMVGSCHLPASPSAPGSAVGPGGAPGQPRGGERQRSGKADQRDGGHVPAIFRSYTAGAWRNAAASSRVVDDVAVIAQLRQDLAYRRRTTARPEHVHDDALKLAETLHRTHPPHRGPFWWTPPTPARASRAICHPTSAGSGPRPVAPRHRRTLRIELSSRFGHRRARYHDRGAGLAGRCQHRRGPRFQ